MAEKKKYNSILISGRKDQTLTYSKYVKDEESGESVKESLDKKVNVTDELTTQQIKDGAITNEKMAADSVGNTNLQDGSVSNEKLDDGSITNEKLAENSITKDKLQDKTIGVEKLDNELRQAIAAATGLPEDLVETIQNVDDTLKNHQRQLDDKQSQIDDKQQQINANDEDISLLQTRSTQMEETIKGIAATGGASQATAVTYENTESGLDSITAQGAIDELANKKFNKENIAQELGDSKDKVVSQFALPFREIDSPEFIKAIVDAEDRFLFGIQLDGSIEWGKGIPTPIRAKLQEIINQSQQDKTDLLESINTLNEELTKKIELTNSDLSSVKENFEVDLKGKSISILGDSLSTFQGYIPEGNAVYYPNTNNDVTAVEQTWWMQLINSSNAVLDTNNSWSGAKVSGNLNSAYTNRIGLVGNPDFLIIHGGTNDIWQNVPVGSLHFEAENSDLNIEEFADSYDLLVRKAITLYPNANIILIIPNISEEYASIINAIYKNYQLFACVDLRNYRFTWSAWHYQIEDMTTVKDAISKKIFVHKDVVYQQGMSLIDNEVASCFRVIENEEFLCAVVDTEDRVLFGFNRATGNPYYPLNEMYHVIQNKEFFAAWIDTNNKVVFGIRRDGEIIGEIHAVNALKQVIYQIQSNLASLQEKVGTIDTNLNELLDVFSLQENPEYLAVEKDTDGKVLSATNLDGSHYFHNIKSETIPTEFEHIEDLEGRTEITTDAENKVMSFRDSQGKKHEHDMEVTNLDVSNLNLKGNSVNNIQDALKANGFDVKTPVDWSENSKIQIPEPNLAFVNITNIASMPTSKTQNMHAIFEFWDMQGNYFKKKVILNAQGNSSLYMPKKNFACDFCNDNWEGDDTFKIKFGNWVPQDSFHFKGFYADFFKGVSMVGYKLFNEIESTRSSCINRVWKRALLPSADTIGYGTKGMKDTTDVNILIDNGARCYPDGFPCIVHLNGSFYGVFSWALKKHRDNYMLNKSKPENIQLDGDIYDTFMYNGTIDWDVINGTKASSGGGMDGFEFRNPKSLICIDGTKYDADTNRKELIDSTSGSYDSSNKNHILTNKVKAYYSTLTTYIPTLKKMEEQSEEVSVIKSKIQSFFDIDSLIDYLIFSDIVTNVDGFRKNWQWITYDGVKWAVCPYDLDGIIGWSGWGELSPTSDRYGNTLDLPTGWVIKYFDTELCERYKTLRTGVLTVKNIFNLLNEWCSRIGASNFEKDLSKWPQTPELYPPFGGQHFDNIYRVENWLIVRIKKCDEIYKFNN